MVTWAPPTPPHDTDDLFVDPTLGFLYESNVMTESELPPIYIPKEPPLKRMRLDSTGTPRVRPKIKKEDIVVAPRSLFDRPSAALLRLRRELKALRLKGLLTGGPDAHLLQRIFSGMGPNQTIPSPPTLVAHAQTSKASNVLQAALHVDSMIPWSILDEWYILQIIQAIQEIPTNLVVVTPGHTPNWDMIADLVSSGTHNFRSSRLCRHHYETVVIPREEGKLVNPVANENAQPKKSKKKPPQGHGLPIGAPVPGPSVSPKSKVPRTKQLCMLDDHISFTNAANSRIDLIANMANKRPPQFKFPPANDQLTRNPIHLQFIQENAVSYENPVSPTQIAIKRQERIQIEKQQQQQAARAEALRLQTLKSKQALQQQLKATQILQQQQSIQISQPSPVATQSQSTHARVYGQQPMPSSPMVRPSSTPAASMPQQPSALPTTLPPSKQIDIEQLSAVGRGHGPVQQSPVPGVIPSQQPQTPPVLSRVYGQQQMALTPVARQTSITSLVPGSPQVLSQQPPTIAPTTTTPLNKQQLEVEELARALSQAAANFQANQQKQQQQQTHSQSTVSQSVQPPTSGLPTATSLQSNIQGATPIASPQVLTNPTVRPIASGVQYAVLQKQQPTTVLLSNVRNLSPAVQAYRQQITRKPVPQQPLQPQQQQIPTQTVQHQTPQSVNQPQALPPIQQLTGQRLQFPGTPMLVNVRRVNVATTTAVSNVPTSVAVAVSASPVLTPSTVGIQQQVPQTIVSQRQPLPPAQQLTGQRFQFGGTPMFLNVQRVNVAATTSGSNAAPTSVTASSSPVLSQTLVSGVVGTKAMVVSGPPGTTISLPADISTSAIQVIPSGQRVISTSATRGTAPVVVRQVNEGDLQALLMRQHPRIQFQTIQPQLQAQNQPVPPQPQTTVLSHTPQPPISSQPSSNDRESSNTQK